MVLTRFSTFILFILVLYLSGASATHGPAGHKKMQRKPCKQLKLFFHNILYNGQNAANATSAIVAAPEGANLTTLASQYHFGNVIVFDNPITLDNNLHSPPVGRAQGMYVYDSKETLSALMGFSLVLNSTEHHGTINFIGANPYLILKTRDISVVGGTGDFAMARGIATFTTDAIEVPVYYRISVDIKLYECW